MRKKPYSLMYKAQCVIEYFTELEKQKSAHSSAPVWTALSETSKKTGVSRATLMQWRIIAIDNRYSPVSKLIQLERRKIRDHE